MLQKDEPYLLISGQRQRLELIHQDKILFEAPASTAKNGFGEVSGSEKTPRGWHEVSEKIGATFPLNAVFVSRVFTGEIYNEALATQHPERDWILTRILWLSGLEPQNATTKSRFIYIHGTPDSKPIGTRHTHGCICLSNAKMAELFDLVSVGTQVLIEE